MLALEPSICSCDLQALSASPVPSSSQNPELQITSSVPAPGSGYSRLLSSQPTLPTCQQNQPQEEGEKCPPGMD